MDFVKVVRDAIRKDGRSLYRLAADSGLSVAIVQRFASGERDIRLATATKLCKALKLELRPITGKGR